MSKPIAKVVVFVLISLALIAATSVGVRSWLDRPGATASAQAHVVGNLSSSTASQLQSFQQQSQSGAVHQGGCHSSGQVSPQDY